MLVKMQWNRWFIGTMLLISVFWQSCLIVQTPFIYEEAKKDTPYDAVIIPGVPYADSSMSDVMNFRVRWAKQLYDDGIAKNIIFSGSAVYTPYVEAKIMAMMGEKLGIPAEHIFVEDKAEHSMENLYYGYLLAQKQGFGRIAVASDQFQTAMLEYFHERFRIYGIGFIPIPFSFLRNMDKTHIMVDAEKAKVENFVSLRDRKTFSQRFRGTKGQNVVKEARSRDR